MEERNELSAAKPMNSDPTLVCSRRPVLPLPARTVIEGLGLVTEA